MRVMETVTELLRPLVGSKPSNWDYCVVWKMGNDPKRFIEWMDCCCGGAKTNIGEEKGRKKPVLQMCKDEVFQHPIRTKACEALANFPRSMPLYSGIRGEVLLASQPRWINILNAPISNPSDESVGTRVLIPVANGLIELFVSKHIPRDEAVLNFIMTHCKISPEQETTSYTDGSLDEYMQDCTPSMSYSSFDGSQNFQLPATHLDYNSPFKGSLRALASSDNHSTLDSEFDRGSQRFAALEQSVRISGGGSKRSRPKNYSIKQDTELVSVSSSCITEEENLKFRRRSEGEQYQSKNLVTERNRRHRIRDKLYALRAVVPNISKMDKSAILSDAVDFIGELQKKVKNLQDELMEMEAEDYDSNNLKTEIKSSNCVGHGSNTSTSKIMLKEELGTRYTTPKDQNQGSSSVNHEKRQMEVQVDVNKISENEFLVKFLSEQNRGGFTRLMEAISSIRLQVTAANITTFRGKVLNILTLEANSGKEVQAQHVNDSLLKLSCDPVGRSI